MRPPFATSSYVEAIVLGTSTFEVVRVRSGFKPGDELKSDSVC
jgi:hypothetical protein